MRIIKLNRLQDVPEIEALIVGPRSRQKVKLIFDTGAVCTQIDTGLMEDIGYSASDAQQIIKVMGAAGQAQEGYLIQAESISFLGKKFMTPTVGVYDFDNFPGVDGLLGWDIISKLHIEMDGPLGTLKVF